MLFVTQKGGYATYALCTQYATDKSGLAPKLIRLYTLLPITVVTQAFRKGERSPTVHIYNIDLLITAEEAMSFAPYIAWMPKRK